MLRTKFLHLNYNMPGPGMEPRTARLCQADMLTTTLPHSVTTTGKDIWQLNIDLVRHESAITMDRSEDELYTEPV